MRWWVTAASLHRILPPSNVGGVGVVVKPFACMVMLAMLVAEVSAQDVGPARSLTNRGGELGAPGVSTGHSAIDLLLDAPSSAASGSDRAVPRTRALRLEEPAGKAAELSEQQALRDALLREAAAVVASGKGGKGGKEEREEPATAAVDAAPVVAANRMAAATVQLPGDEHVDGVLGAVVNLITWLRDNRGLLVGVALTFAGLALAVSVSRAMAGRGRRTAPRQRSPSPAHRVSPSRTARRR